MKIVVTGASGHLGSHLIPLLQKEGFDVAGIDMAVPAQAVDFDFVQMSLDQRDKLPAALVGADLVVHAASIHPWKQYPDSDYLDANIKGTWQLFSALVEARVRNVVLTSSIAAAGYHDVPVSAWPVSEERQFALGDLYSLTKQTQEQIARHFAGAAGIRTFALRPPAFMPLPELETGFQLTANFCLVDDVARAHVLATRKLLDSWKPQDESGFFEAFFTVNRLPYQAGDATLLADGRDISPLVEKYWPAEYLWLKANGFVSARVAALYDISKAHRVLGWTPQFNFEQWAAEHVK